MNHIILNSNRKKEIAKLFTSVFTSSEGIKEGKLIGNLASELSSNIDNENIICLGTYDKKSLIGCIFFTLLHFNNDILVYMLAPVAVSTKHQRKGVGQALINYGLNMLKERSVDIAITYGDPNFYSKVGFEPLSENIIQAPLKLSIPEGWLGQSFTDTPIPLIKEHPTCVSEFNNPIYW